MSVGCFRERKGIDFETNFGKFRGETELRTRGGLESSLNMPQADEVFR